LTIFLSRIFLMISRFEDSMIEEIEMMRMISMNSIISNSFYSKQNI
jgi:hypothetical protein